MQPSLFVEHQATGIAFYIDGELQFHSADERIYHEYLVIPALALARQRFQMQKLRVLICGGGDGLAVREVLRFTEVCHVDLVDYDPAVIELAKTEFTPFNENSLAQERVQIHIHEAFAFLRQQAESIDSKDDSVQENGFYHVMICDFTYPLRQEYTDIYAQEWFSLLRSRLMPDGLLAVNGFSPNHNTMAFWCLYQTIRAADFHCLPMRLNVPSFSSHDYGYWGFMLASTAVITADHIAKLQFPQGLQALTPEGLCQSFRLPKDLVAYLLTAQVHHQGSSQLFFYLLNRKSLAISREIPEALSPLLTEVAADLRMEEPDLVNFLDSQPRDLPQQSDQQTNPDPLAMATLAAEWLHLSQKYLDAQIAPNSIPETSPLPPLPLPVQHFYHTPEMMYLWRERLQYLLSYLDWRQLFEKLKAKRIPKSEQSERNNNPKFTANNGMDDMVDQQSFVDDVAKLEQIYANITAMKGTESKTTLVPSVKLPQLSRSELASTTRTITLVGLILLLANTVAPDAAFAKGSFFGISTSSSSSGGDDGGFFSWGLTGLFLTVGGIAWLNSLAEAERLEREAQNQVPPSDDEDT